MTFTSWRTCLGQWLNLTTRKIMGDIKQTTPEEIRQRIQQLIQSRIIIDTKMVRLRELRQLQQAEIDRLTQLL